MGAITSKPTSFCKDRANPIAIPACGNRAMPKYFLTMPLAPDTS